MNPESPIEITASGNTVLFAFDKGQYVGIKLRILDENGKVLASLLDEDSRYTLTVSPEAKNYYVECKDTGYSYFLLRIKSGPKYSQPSVSGQNKEYAIYQETLKEYMRQHSITNRKDLTEADMRKIGLIMQEKLYGKEAANQQRIAQEVVDAYMKRKGIKDTSDLTNKDWEILRQEISSAVYRWKSQPAKKSAPAKRRKSR